MANEPKTPSDINRTPDDTSSDFLALNLPDDVTRGVVDAGFKEMTPIQQKALPITLAGQDICGQAQTGTGKTAAFLIAMFSRMIQYPVPNTGRPRALVLAPTRELALQIFREAKLLGIHTPFKQVAIYGGEGYSHQENILRSGVDVVVGTPGRLLDFAKRRILQLQDVEYLVIDEADRLMDMGFWEELRSILRLLPHAKKRQSMLFSATLDYRARKIAWSFMNDPKDVIIRPESVAADGIDQVVYHVEMEMKISLLLGLLKKEEISKGLIFANMKITANWITKKLQQHGFEVGLLTGDLRQRVRTTVLERFATGEVPLLVASDVASRGLHINDVSHIINFDVPLDAEDYVHRIGRTARAGKKGKAFTLACDQYCYYLPEIEKLLGSSIPSKVPFDDDYGQDQTPEYTRDKHVYLERKMERERKRNSPHSGGRGRGGPPRSNKGGGPRPQSRRPYKPKR